MINQVKEYAVSLLFPPVCPFCEKIMDKEQEPVCGNCLQALSFIKGPVCEKCGKELKENEAVYCQDCTEGRHLFSSGRTVWKYEGAAAASILRFKYHDRKSYADIYAEWVCRCLGRWIRSLQIDQIIPVPIHKKRLRSRGYNQAALLADSIGRKLQIPVDKTSVCRRKNTVPQKNLTAFARMENMQQAFTVKGEDIIDKRILIVDDIYTTGVTIDAMAYVLLKAGARRVYFAALASGGT